VQHFEQLDPMLAALESRADVVLKEQLAAGARALTEGRSEAAQAAFELALKIEPKNAVATRGLARAGTLDRVLALLASAERAEKDGDTTAALADYRQALELDKDMTRASEGIARVSARVAGDQFASAMARGFAELGADNYAAARSAFESAGRIRPNAPEVADALKQVEQSERTRSIAAQLEAARGAEAREQWADALKTYKDVLALDSTVAAAKEGVARVQPRAELNEQLELYLTQPERLFSSPVRAAARQTLERAGAIANPGPVLTQQIAKLRDWLAKADVPVQVALQSDNLTQVTIFRVGALGAFEQRSLELAPGEYTVVGTRPGYRDVRRQIMVMPGKPMPPIVIRCEDRI
jgi:tetratricopeptide (TPR) repeat protein